MKNQPLRMRQRRSPDLTVDDVAIIKALLERGEMQHSIAAKFGVNQGRISEIKTGKRFAEVPVAQIRKQ